MKSALNEPIIGASIYRLSIINNRPCSPGESRKPICPPQWKRQPAPAAYRPIRFRQRARSYWPSRSHLHTGSLFCKDGLTRASERVAMRNRLYQQLIELLHQKPEEQ